MVLSLSGQGFIEFFKEKYMCAVYPPPFTFSITVSFLYVSSFPLHLLHLSHLKILNYTQNSYILLKLFLLGRVILILHPQILYSNILSVIHYIV